MNTIQLKPIATSGGFFCENRTNMAVSQNLINELKDILCDETGKDFDLATASAIGNGWIGYFDKLAQIYHSDKETVDKKFNS